MVYYTHHIIVNNNDAIDIRDRLLLEFESDIVLIDADRVICENQVFAAVKRANFARVHNKMMAKVWGLEVMVQIAGSHQISEAMKMLNITTNTQRILIISDKKDIEFDNIEKGFPKLEINSELIELYQLRTKEICLESIAKGVLMVNNHQ